LANKIGCCSSARLLWVTVGDLRLDLHWCPLRAYPQYICSCSGTREPFKGVLSIVLPNCHLYL